MNQFTKSTALSFFLKVEKRIKELQDEAMAIVAPIENIELEPEEARTILREMLPIKNKMDKLLLQQAEAEMALGFPNVAYALN